MKAALIIASGIKQIMLTAESDEEKAILECFSLKDDIKLEVKKGKLYDYTPESALGYAIRTCRGDYLRAYESEESLMLVLTPKKQP